MSATTETTKKGIRDILLFNVAGSVCGIDVLMIQEVRKDFEITPVQLSPDYVSGVMNLRGEIATVFNLALKLGISEGFDPKTAKVIVLKNKSGEYEGLLVDDIADVIQVGESEINNSPSHMTSIKPEFIEGICRHEEELVALLKLSAIFSSK